MEHLRRWNTICSCQYIWPQSLRELCPQAVYAYDTLGFLGSLQHTYSVAPWRSTNPLTLTFSCNSRSTIFYWQARRGWIPGYCVEVSAGLALETLKFVCKLQVHCFTINYCVMRRVQQPWNDSVEWVLLSFTHLTICYGRKRSRDLNFMLKSPASFLCLATQVVWALKATTVWG